MGKRKRYDTQALVTRLQTEENARRTWLKLAVFVLFTGIGWLAYMVFSGGVEPGEAVALTEEAKPQAENPEQKADAAPEQPEVKDEEDAVAAGPARLRIKLSKAGALWIDGERIPKKVKSKEVEIEPGAHTLKVKFGKKIIETDIEIEGGQTAQLRFNPKKKKPAIKILSSDEAAAPQAAELSERTARRSGKKGRRRKRRR